MLTEKEFIKAIEENQQIIFKVSNMYMDTKADREDLFQEILLNAWKGIRNFKGDSKFSTWLYRVALNTSISFFKKDKKEQEVLDWEKSRLSIPEASNIEMEQFAAMNIAISELSRVDKALVMLYLEDYSYQQIAEVLGITANHVGVKMSRIKVLLKENSKKYLSQ
ncbi:MAG: sigma-70 family RNA polymerase sigma factor [Chitinophagaceae bacterium]